MSETGRVSCQNKSVKLVHLFGFYYKENNFLCKAYWPHFEEYQFVRQESCFPAPSVMESFGVEIDLKPTCFDPPFRSLFTVPANMFCIELYSLSLVYRSIRP
jgi:hypothetical protein